MNKLLLFLLFISSACLGQSGKISGNVFWKYNDYVGNKPDAGSEITALKLNNPNIKYSATADVSGNYIIPTMDTGNYIVVIKSASTHADPNTSYQKLLIYSKNFISLNNSFSADFESALKDSIRMKQQEYESYRDGKKVKQRKLEGLSDELQKMIFRYYRKMLYSLAPLSIYSAFQNIDYKYVTVKPGDEQRLVTDFGTTYF
jgi:hypothetical protein